MTSITAPLAAPYIGLRPFDESEEPLFFGRSEERETLTANILTSPLTLLYGASGAGKTSVLQAGIVPRLRELAGASVTLFRNWQRATFLEELTSAVAASVQREGASFVDLLSQRRDIQHVLILDQFEEYFLYHSGVAAGDAFESALAQVINRPELDVNVLVAIREDALSLLGRFRHRIPNLFSNYLRLGHLTAMGAQEAIELPLRAFRDAAGASWTVDDALIGALISELRVDVVNAPFGSIARSLGPFGAGEDSSRVDTALLQLTLSRLWEEERARGSRRLRSQTLADLGGAAEVIRTHLDKTMATLSKPYQKTSSKVFNFLVTPSGAKIAHTVSDLSKYSEVDEKTLTEVMEALSSGSVRILRRIPPPSNTRAEPRFEIFHDILAPAILGWRERYLEGEWKDEAKVRHRKVLWGLGFGFFLVAVLYPFIGSIAAGGGLRRAYRTLRLRERITGFHVWWWIFDLISLIAFLSIMSYGRGVDITAGADAVQRNLGNWFLPVVCLRAFPAPLAVYIAYRLKRGSLEARERALPKTSS